MGFGSVSLVLLLVTLSLCIVPSNTMTYGERVKLREDARNMFYHAYSNYMESAYPADELKPLSCTGRGSEGRGSLDDVLGGFSLTLIDALDTLVVLEDFEEFERASRLVIKHVTFNRNAVVSVFETTIRVLGGLLSAHLMSVEHSARLKKGYNGELLLMATELGDRMLPAFNTPTGIPYSRVNLMMGIPRGEPPETCTAGAGTLILEFGLLSKLTGNPAYMNAARRAIIEIWNRRSQINLVGNVINVATGQWIRGDSSIGAGIDSFFEYLLKGYVLFGDLELYNILVQAYNSMEKYGKKGSWYVSVHMVNGNVVREWVESLQMFWPGLQVSLGQVSAAAENFNTYYQLWRRYGLPPEAYSIHAKTPVPGVSGYPLRPEMIESAYMLFSATHDHSYLHAGKFIMQNIVNYTRVECGFAAVSDVLTKKLEDRFDSYFLSETCKYLYLLFDPDNAPYYKDIVFTTEGHLIPLRYEYHDQARESVNGKYASHNSLTCKNPQTHKNTPLFPPPSVAKAKPSSKKSSPSSSSPPPPPPRPSPKAPKAPTFEQLAQQFSTEDVLDEPPRTVVEAKLDGEDQVFMVVSANFGPPIESEFRAKLVYGIPADGCVPLTFPVPSSSPTIVLLDRGTCMFGEKVRIASKAGVEMVMIVDNINQPNVFLMTDGLLESHGPVSIPSFLVNRSIGDRIKASLLSSEEDYYITVRPAEEDEFFAEEAQFYAQTQQLAINLPAGGLMNQDSLAEAVLQQLQQMQIKVDGSFSIQYMDANNQPAMLTINGDSVKIGNQNLFIPPATEEKTAESTLESESESESSQESKYSSESPSKNSKLHETGQPNP